jgi:DNA polymerase-3 subunit epsilon
VTGPAPAPGGSLAQRAAERLRGGPLHTLALARDVLGLEGHPGAASAAVFALLGTDPRFRVDPAGVWTLDPGPVGTPLHELAYAVVDVETTGGSPRSGHRVTEIAIVEVSGGIIRDEYTTLINPGRSILPVVTALTGITTSMVDSAPWFDHVAPTVADRLAGRVFVAHNAGFDHAFVRTELVQALGEAPRTTTLCTVKLARALLPRLRKRNLDALAAWFGIRIHARHRAHGDALATARVLIRLLDEAGHQGIHDLHALRRVLRQRARRRSRGRGRRGPHVPGGREER